jgi:hypothetical protein
MIDPKQVGRTYTVLAFFEKLPELTGKSCTDGQCIAHMNWDDTWTGAKSRLPRNFINVKGMSGGLVSDVNGSPRDVHGVLVRQFDTAADADAWCTANKTTVLADASAVLVTTNARAYEMP